MALTKEELEDFQKASVSSGVSNLSQEDLESFNSFEPGMAVQPDEAKGVGEFVKYLGKKYQLGDAAIRNGALGRKVMDESMTYEEAEQLMQADDETRVNQLDVEEYEKNTNLFYVPQIMGATIGTIPFMLQGLKGAASGAALGAGAGFFMGVPGPMAGYGAALGTAHVTSEIAAGNSYLAMRAKGIPHDVAKHMSIVDGAVQGTIEAFQMGQTGKLVGETAKNATKPLKEVAAKHFQEFFKYMGEQLLEEEAQTLSELQFRGMAALVSGRPDAAPTMQERSDEYWNTFKESSKAFLGMFVGGKIAGFGAGKAAKLLKLQMEETNKRIDKKIAEEKQAAAEKALTEAPVEISTEVKAELFKGGVKEQNDAGPRTSLAGKVDELRAQIKELKGKTDPESKLLRGQLKEDLALARLDEANEALDIAMSENTTPEQRLKLESKLVDAKINYRRLVLDTYQTELQAKADALQKDMNAIGKEVAARQRVQELRAQIQELKGAKDEESIAERSALQQELDSIKVEGTSIRGLANELAKKEAQLELIDEDLRALNSLSVAMNNRQIAENAHGLDTIITKLKSNKVKGLLNRVLKDMTTVAKDSRKLAQQETKMVQRLISDLIDASNLENKEKFQKQIKNVVSLSDLQKLLPELDMKIQQALDAEELKAARQNLMKAIGIKTIRDGRSVFGTETDAIFGDERVQKTFDMFEAFIRDEVDKDSKGLSQKAIDAFDQALSANQDVTELELPSFVAQQVIGLKDKTSVEVTNLANTIRNLVKGGLDKALEARVKRREEYQRVAAFAENAFNGDYAKDKRVPTDMTYADPNVLNQILGVKHLPSSTNALLSSWEGKIAWGAQHSRNAEALVKMLDVHKAVQEVITNTRKQTERYHELLKEASPNGKFNGALKLILLGAKSEKLEGFQQADGTWRESITLSPNQAVRLWLQLKDRDLDSARLEGNKYTLKGETFLMSTEEMLENYFKREDRKPYLQMASALQKFYTENFARVNEATIDEFGRELKRNENYSGYAAHVDDKAADFLKDWQASLSMRANPRTPGPTFDRTRTKSPLKPVDAFVDVYFQIQAFEHWNTWRKASKPLAAALLNPRTKAILVQKYGKRFYNGLVAHFIDLVGGSHLHNNMWNQVMSGLLNRFADVMLLARPVQFFKNLTGTALVFTKVNELEAVEGYIDFFKHPAESWKNLTQSDAFKNRYDAFMQSQIGALVKQSDSLKALQMVKIRDLLGVFIKSSDILMYVASGHVIYKNAIKKGMTHEQALDEAGRYANLTAGSGTVDQLSNLARSPLGRMFTLLTQQPTRMLEKQVTDVMRAINFPSAKNIDQARRSIFYAAVADVMFNLVGYMWKALFEDDEDKLESSAIDVALSILGPIRSAALIGPAVNNGVKMALNILFDADIHIYDWGIPPVDVAKRTGQFIKQTGEAIVEGDDDPETWAKIFDAYVRGPNILIGGAPLLEASDQAKNLAKE